MDTGFVMWSFQGKLLFRNPTKVDKFCQLLWRPRPPSLLTADDIAVRSILMMYIYIGQHTCMLTAHSIIIMCAHSGSQTIYIIISAPL